MSSELLKSPSRRSLVKGAAGVGVIALFQAWQVQHLYAAGSSNVVAGPYGPVAPVKDLTTGLELLQLPADFEYRSFAWTGDTMSNGEPCPGSHDGMAVVGEHVIPGVGLMTILIRNHELGLGTPIGAPARYDTAFINGGSSGTGYPAGGNTILGFRGRQWVNVGPAFGGTLVNCAGGSTPWGSWLTCEETLSDLTSLGGKKHGYVFEVRMNTTETTGNPIVGMGRMSHEAVAVDPATNAVYLTEDNRNMSGFYRFLPADTSGTPGSLEHGGQLQAARVVGTPNANLNVADVGQSFQIEWVAISNPDANPGAFNDPPTVTGTASGPFLQARSQGCLRMARGEGIWYHAGKMFIVDTATGMNSSNRPGNGEGAVWVLDLATMRMQALFVSENRLAANNPDNITVSPRGGVVLCEDGGGVTDAFGFGERMLGLTPAGESYVFCKNNTNLSAGDISAAGKSVAPGDYRDNEFAGACFDRAGNVMFANMQSPGITYAIWGPWRKGNL
jgi:secreted PhoX family phosphatase